MVRISDIEQIGKKWILMPILRVGIAAGETARNLEKWPNLDF
jgi:hypothetical protein